MKRISRQFPQFFFTLYGSGEEDDDRWVAYFLGGASQHEYAEINYKEPISQVLKTMRRWLPLKRRHLRLNNRTKVSKN